MEKAKSWQTVCKTIDLHMQVRLIIYTHKWYNYLIYKHEWCRCSVTMQRDGMGGGVEGRFRREEIYVYSWLIHAVLWQKPT